MKISFLSIINQDSFRSYTTPIAKYLGSVHAAIMLSELIGRYEYHEKKNELIDCPKNGPGWFYYTVETGIERTCLTDREQATALKILIEKDLIEAVVFGLPAKRHFRVKIEKIADIFCFSKKESSYAENAELDVRKTQNHICGKRGTDPQGKSTRIHIQEKEEETKEEKQQTMCVAASFEAMEILKDVNIPQDQKEQISKKYPPEDIRHAVKWAKHPRTKISETLEQALKWACTAKPQIPKDKEDEAQENKILAMKYEGKSNEYARVDALNGHVEIVYTSCMKVPKCIEYTEKAFKEIFENELRKSELL